MRWVALPLLVVAAAAADGPLVPAPLRDLGRTHKVWPIYFVPADREPQPKWREKIGVQLRYVADFYRRELARQGHETRGLDFVFADGALDVRLVRGGKKATHYSGAPKYDKDRLWRTVSSEIVVGLGHPKRRIYVVFAETHERTLVNGGYPGGNAESAPTAGDGGLALVSASMLEDAVCGATLAQQQKFLGDDALLPNADGTGKQSKRSDLAQLGSGVLAHELGHPLYLLHDQRDARNVMAFGYRRWRLAFDPKAPAGLVRFSPEHGRMLARGRYLSERFDASDATAPKVRFALARPPTAGQKEVWFKVEASDDRGLAALLYYESTLDSVIGGESLAGEKRFTVARKYHRGLLRAGQLLHWKILAIDVNGNVGVALLAKRVEKK